MNPTTTAALRATSETEPRTAEQIQVTVGINFTRRATAYYVLGNLRNRGFVKAHYADWPVTWSRTERGTAFLAETKEGVAVDS